MNIRKKMNFHSSSGNGVKNFNQKPQKNPTDKTDVIKSNKRKWQSQKVNAKNKLDEWQYKRNSYFKYGFRKEQNRLKATKFDVKKIYDEEEQKSEEQSANVRSLIENEIEENVERKTGKGKSKYLKRLEKEQEEEERKQELLRKKEEKEAALKRYRKEKIERHKILNKKTKKGQPVMKGRMEMLFEEIKSKYAQ